MAAATKPIIRTAAIPRLIVAFFLPLLFSLSDTLTTIANTNNYAEGIHQQENALCASNCKHIAKKKVGYSPIYWSVLLLIVALAGDISKWRCAKKILPENRPPSRCQH